MNKVLEDIYLKSPSLFQKILINFQGARIKSRRLGKQFHYYLQEYLESDPRKIDLPNFRLFLFEALRTPFWRERFERFSIDIKSDQILDEIKKLPVLTKDEVKKNHELITNTKRQNSINWNQTSGSTGSGLVFPQTNIMEQKQWAIWWRYRILNGIDYGTWMGWFGGRSILDINKKSPPFHRINYPMKQIMFSAHHLNRDTAIHYYNILKEKKIKWLHGYPSQIALLAHIFDENKFKHLHEVSYITVGAENLMDHQKNAIENVFQVPVFQHYGLAEGVSNISEIGSKLIPDQDFAYTEFIPNDEFDNTSFKIIGTNYNNTSFPLIRYDTGDIAKMKMDIKNISVINSIDGRNEDYVVLPNQIKLGRLDHIFKGFNEVKEAQIYQKKNYDVVLRVVTCESIDRSNTGKKILHEARKKLGYGVNLEIEYVQKVPRTKSGKIKFVISEIVNK